MSDYLKFKFDPNDEKVISTFDEAPLWSVPFGMALLDEINFKPGINALDIGCGTGYPLIELAQRLGAGSRVYGLDPWDAALKRAKEKISKYQLLNVELVEGIAEKMPFEDNFFSLIVSNNGLNNVSDMDAVLQECHRVTKDGAQLVVTMNLPETFIGFYQTFEKVLREFGFEEIIERLKEHIYQKRKPVGFTTKLLQNNGFTIDNVKESIFNYRFADGTAFLNHYFIKLGFMDSWKALIPQELLTKVFSKIEAYLNDSATKSGGITLGVPFACFNCTKSALQIL